MSAVYFLIKNSIVIYIGQSRNVEQRLLSHRNKDYDTLRIIKCDVCKLLEYERRWIRHFNPTLNGKPGAPRKEKTVVIRVPESKLEDIKKVIK